MLNDNGWNTATNGQATLTPGEHDIRISVRNGGGGAGPNSGFEAGIQAHIEAVADAADLPVMVYDIPIRTGRKINSATLLRLFREVPNIVALKDAAANPGETAAVISSLPPILGICMSVTIRSGR